MLEELKKEILHGGHIQSLGAVIITTASSFLLQERISFALLILIYLLFYSFYLFNRAGEVYIDFLTNPERAKYILKHYSKVPYILSLDVVLIGLVLFKINNTIIWIVSSLFLLFGFFYTIWFKKVTKYIPLFKNFYVAACFAVLVFYPILYNEGSFGKVAILFAIFILLKTALIQVFFDIKDIKGDKKEGLKTLPVLIGKDNTIFNLILFSFLITIIYLFLAPELKLIFIFSFLFNVVVYLLLKNYPKISYYLAIGEFGVWFLIIIFLVN